MASWRWQVASMAKAGETRVTKPAVFIKNMGNMGQAGYNLTTGTLSPG